LKILMSLSRHIFDGECIRLSGFNKGYVWISDGVVAQPKIHVLHNQSSIRAFDEFSHRPSNNLSYQIIAQCRRSFC
jgi:hypothetical protein